MTYFRKAILITWNWFNTAMWIIFLQTVIDIINQRSKSIKSGIFVLYDNGLFTNELQLISVIINTMYNIN